MQPRQHRNLGRPDQVRRPQTLRGDDLLPHRIGKCIGRVKVLSAIFDVRYNDADMVLMIRPLDGRSGGVIACTTCTGPQ